MLTGRYLEASLDALLALAFAARKKGGINHSPRPIAPPWPPLSESLSPALASNEYWSEW
jgi:hypothetical protein